jgi:hypothetical protein
MYPLEDYIRARTSGTAGKEKWLMIPKIVISKTFRETAIESFFTIFHDGEKITLEYGDNIYVNTAPRPFVGGFLIPETGSFGIVNIVPNINLSYNDKIRYFIMNPKKLHAAVMLASTLVSQIMPAISKPIKLKGFLCTDANIAEVYKDDIEKFTGVAPKTLYGSAETIMPSVPSIQHSLGFIFDWRRGLFEFLPEDDETNMVEMDEVKVGNTYRLIFTSFNGELTRYDTGDSIVCVAKGDDIINTDYPVFKFQARLEKTISLQNFTRISEEELLTVFKMANIPFREFTTRVEIEKGQEYLTIYIEHLGSMTTQIIEKAIHKQLYEIDGDYRDLVDFFNYIPLKIKLVPRGVFAQYKNEVATAMHKVDRINMRDGKFKQFLRIVEELHGS